MQPWSNRPLGGVDPADGRGRRQRVEIVHDHDEPIQRRSRGGGLSDPGAERGEECARRARRRVVDSRNSGPGARMEATPPARWLADSARLAAASDSAVSAATR